MDRENRAGARQSTAASLRNAVRDQWRSPNDMQAAMAVLERPPRPVIVDANRIRGELKRLARGSEATAMVSLSQAGFLHLFAAQHVLDEVDEHLPEWADAIGTPLTDLERAWGMVLRPLITHVAFTSELLTPEEAARIEVLARPEPVGDPDDVPTAIAAMVLHAPLISGDAKPLRAVYGEEMDRDQHDAYVSALMAGGQVLAMSSWGYSLTMLTRIAGALTTGTVRKATSWLGPVPVVAATVAGLTWLWSSPKVKPLRTQSAAALGTSVEVMAEVLALYRKAEADYARLPNPRLKDHEALSPGKAAARSNARETALQRATAAQAERTRSGTGGPGGHVVPGAHPPQCAHRRLQDSPTT